MRLLLVRHGETIHNVAGVYAGITDSALTNHGVLQAKRLGAHLAANQVRVSHIFSSDLQRAFGTAEAIRLAQKDPPSKTVKVRAIREQDFGFYEMKQFFERPRDGNKSGKEAHQDVHRNDPGFQDVEGKDSMRERSDTFIDTHLVHLLDEVPEDHTVVVVAHGIILSHLWRAFLKRFHIAHVSIGQGVETPGNGLSLEHLGGWSNTGYLDLEIKPRADVPASSKGVLSKKTGTETAKGAKGHSDVFQGPATSPSATSPTSLPLSKLPNLSLVVKAVNKKDHLTGLKKTRGGIGSLQHDTTQKTMDSFFKKRRLE